MLDSLREMFGICDYNITLIFINITVIMLVIIIIFISISYQKIYSWQTTIIVEKRLL